MKTRRDRLVSSALALALVAACGRASEDVAARPATAPFDEPGTRSVSDASMPSASARVSALLTAYRSPTASHADDALRDAIRTGQLSNRDVAALIDGAAAIPLASDGSDPQMDLVFNVLLDETAIPAEAVPALELAIPALRPAARRVAFHALIVAPDGVDRYVALAPRYPEDAIEGVDVLDGGTAVHRR